MSRHRHQWTEAGRVFAPPQHGAEITGGTIEFAKQLAFGVTSIELRCECGDVAERRLLGDHVSQEKSMLRG